MNLAFVTSFISVVFVSCIPSDGVFRWWNPFWFYEDENWTEIGTATVHEYNIKDVLLFLDVAERTQLDKALRIGSWGIYRRLDMLGLWRKLLIYLQSILEFTAGQIGYKKGN